MEEINRICKLSGADGASPEHSFLAECLLEDLLSEFIAGHCKLGGASFNAEIAALTADIYDNLNARIGASCGDHSVLQLCVTVCKPHVGIAYFFITCSLLPFLTYTYADLGKEIGACVLLHENNVKIVDNSTEHVSWWNYIYQHRANIYQHICWGSVIRKSRQRYPFWYTTLPICQTFVLNNSSFDAQNYFIQWLRRRMPWARLWICAQCCPTVYSDRPLRCNKVIHLRVCAANLCMDLRKVWGLMGMCDCDERLSIGGNKEM